MKNAIQSLIKKALSGHPTLNRIIRLQLRRHRLRTAGHPNWRKLIENRSAQWTAARHEASTGPKVLLATSMGAHIAGTCVESMLGTALTLRGVDVHVLLCDTTLPACLECQVGWYPTRKHQEHFLKHGPTRDLCRDCFQPACDMYSSLGFTVHRYSEYLTSDDKETARRLASTLSLAEMSAFRHEGVAIGEHAVAGALRYFARATLDDEPTGLPVMRRYFEAALLATNAMRRLCKKQSFTCAVFHHGIYVPQGLIGEVARQQGVRVVNWNPAYRKRCFIFSHDDTYHHTLLSEPTSKWETMEWTVEMEEQLMRYLKSRWKGTEDWIWFHERPQVDLAMIRREVGIDFARPCIGMLTNVMWDAQLHYPANAFPSMLEWLLETIAYFSRRPELQLLIRVHPAELHGTLLSRQPIVNEIRKAFLTLPRNVFVVPPESQISTYAACSQCNTVIVYGTKTGVELTSVGIPVIVAGEAWIRGKGVTMDASSREHYFRLLDQLPGEGRLSAATTTRARKYAYHFFFRRMIPLECIEPTNGSPPFQLKLKSLKHLMPGHSRGLDVVCDGILTGSDFILGRR